MAGRTMDFEKYINLAGRSVCLHMPDGWSSCEYRAVISPIRYKNKMYLQGEYTAIGTHHTGYYLYIGPARHDLTKLGEGAYLTCGDEKYIIDRSERNYCGNEISHIWAILRNTEGEE